jgi:hypothetical protein
MRKGGSEFIDASATPEEGMVISDWLNLPAGAAAMSLWDSLHDAHVISIRSNLLARSMAMSCEIEHLRSFHRLDEGFLFILHLRGRAISASASLCNMARGVFNSNRALS